MSGTSETFCRIVIKGAIRDKKTTLSALRINPRKKILGAAEGGVSHRWLDYQFGCIDTFKQELRGHERIRAIVGPGLTRPKRMSQSQRPAFNRGSTSVASEKTSGPNGKAST
jgi:hypothetical protein